MQNDQVLKAEIVSTLDSLSSDSLKLLAKFVAFLQTDAAQEEIEEINLEQKFEVSSQVTRISSPRLVHREQVAGFKKEIVEVVADDSL